MTSQEYKGGSFSEAIKRQKVSMLHFGDLDTGVKVQLTKDVNNVPLYLRRE